MASIVEIIFNNSLLYELKEDILDLRNLTRDLLCDKLVIMVRRGVSRDYKAYIKLYGYSSLHALKGKYHSHHIVTRPSVAMAQ